MFGSKSPLETEDSTGRESTSWVRIGDDSESAFSLKTLSLCETILFLYLTCRYLFSSETPATAQQKIFFSNNAVHERDPAEIKITWNQYNLTSNLNAVLQISLWGYRETTIRPELQYIDILEVSGSRFPQFSFLRYRNQLISLMNKFINRTFLVAGIYYQHWRLHHHTFKF